MFLSWWTIKPSTISANTTLSFQVQLTLIWTDWLHKSSHLSPPRSGLMGLWMWIWTNSKQIWFPILESIFRWQPTTLSCRQIRYCHIIYEKEHANAFVWRLFLSFLYEGNFCYRPIMRKCLSMKLQRNVSSQAVKWFE